jgi:predicted HicB family RNase H-like nuclease
MSAPRYKDFQGSVDFEDDRLIIRILHIDDLVTTEIDSASTAQAAFAELVEDYLATCTELGKQPCKPFKGSFNVRVTPELHRQVAMAAAEVGESMNAWISNALEAHIERQKAKPNTASVNQTSGIYRSERCGVEHAAPQGQKFPLTAGVSLPAKTPNAKRKVP